MSRAIQLEQLHIPQPCHADWNAMAGDERSRYCASCEKHVHDLSAMSRAQAEALVTAHAGKLCVQFTLGTDGRVMTRDGLRRFRWVRRFAPVVSVAMAFALGLVGCRRNDNARLTGTPLPGETIVRPQTGRAVVTTRPTTVPSQYRGEPFASPPATGSASQSKGEQRTPVTMMGDVDFHPTTQRSPKP